VDVQGYPQTAVLIRTPLPVLWAPVRMTRAAAVRSVTALAPCAVLQAIPARLAPCAPRPIPVWIASSRRKPGWWSA